MDEMERRLKKRQRRRMGDGWMDGWMDGRRTWLTQSFDRRTDPTVGQKVEGDNSYAETPKDRR